MNPDMILSLTTLSLLFFNLFLYCSLILILIEKSKYNCNYINTELFLNVLLVICLFFLLYIYSYNIHILDLYNMHLNVWISMVGLFNFFIYLSR